MILLVDGSNQFLRCYCAFSTCTGNGEPYGGVQGFLITMATVMSKMPFTKVVVVFDAPGGSQRRKKINPEYKAGRKPARLNRLFEIADPEQNKNAQLQNLREYLSFLPISVLSIDNIEADDVIAYTCLLYPDERKVIVSSDADFHQLLNNSTIIYKPTKKIFFAPNDLIAEEKIYPCNYALARAFVGDRSDNLKGIHNIGYKRLVSLVPAFAEPKALTADDVFAFCGEQKSPVYKTFLEHKKLVTDNYQIMQLNDPLISLASIGVIKSALRNPPGFQKMKFKEKLIRDGLNIEEAFLQKFQLVDRMNQQCQPK